MPDIRGLTGQPNAGVRQLGSSPPTGPGGDIRGLTGSPNVGLRRIGSVHPESPHVSPPPPPPIPEPVILVGGGPSKLPANFFDRVLDKIRRKRKRERILRDDDDLLTLL